MQWSARGIGTSSSDPCRARMVLGNHRGVAKGSWWGIRAKGYIRWGGFWWVTSLCNWPTSCRVVALNRLSIGSVTSPRICEGLKSADTWRNLGNRGYKSTRRKVNTVRHVSLQTISTSAGCFRTHHVHGNCVRDRTLIGRHWENPLCSVLFCGQLEFKLPIEILLYGILNILQRPRRWSRDKHTDRSNSNRRRRMV